VFAILKDVYYTGESYEGKEETAYLQIAQDLNAHRLITKPSYPKVLRKVLETIIPKLNTSQLKQAVKEA
jgi:acetylglutamate kinase